MYKDLESMDFEHDFELRDVRFRDQFGATRSPIASSYCYSERSRNYPPLRREWLGYRGQPVTSDDVRMDHRYQSAATKRIYFSAASAPKATFRDQFIRQLRRLLSKFWTGETVHEDETGLLAENLTNGYGSSMNAAATSRLVRKTMHIEGAESGFGFHIAGGSENGPAFVSRVDPNRPAAHAGVKPGQFIYSVNDTVLFGMPHDEVVKFMVKCREASGKMRLTVLESAMY